MKNEHYEPVNVYERLKETPPEKLTSDELSKAIKEDIRCALFVPKGMQVEGMPKLSKQEIEDIRLVADTFFLDMKFSKLPPERRTEAVSQAAVSACCMYLKDVPENIKTDEFIINALRKDGDALLAIDSERLTPEMYNTAVETTGTALRLVPPEIITPEMAAKAVENSGMAIVYVPSDLKTPEMCRNALNSVCSEEFDIVRHIPHSDVIIEHLKRFEQRKDDPFMVFGSVKPEVITPEMAQLAVRLDPSCIQFVPDKLITPEMCMTAVKRDWMNMRFIPASKISKELSEIAMMRSIHAQQFVPARYKSPELYMYPVKINGLNLEYVPENFRTGEVCLQAVKSDPNAVDFVPQRFTGPYNVYEFNGRLKDELICANQLSFEQVQKAFNGEKVEVSGMKFANVTLKDFTLSFDTKTRRINAKPHDDKPETKQEQRQPKRKGVRM